MGVQSGGSFSKTDAAAMTKVMDCKNQGITSLKGIEYFTGLTNLCIDYNSVNTVNLSENVNLTTLECRQCNLSSPGYLCFTKSN